MSAGAGFSSEAQLEKDPLLSSLRLLAEPISLCLWDVGASSKSAMGRDFQQVCQQYIQSLWNMTYSWEWHLITFAIFYWLGVSPKSCSHSGKEFTQRCKHQESGVMEDTFKTVCHNHVMSYKRYPLKRKALDLLPLWPQESFLILWDSFPLMKIIDNNTELITLLHLKYNKYEYAL